MLRWPLADCVVFLTLWSAPLLAQEPNWVLKSSANSPPGRDYPATAYDAARGQLVLFGGESPSTLNDTWIWDGTNWTQKAPANSPTPRFGHAMAYDAAHSQVVLFGGQESVEQLSTGVRNDTWIWDGTNWTQKFPANSPTPRYVHAMAYDSVHSQVVLFGGYDFGYCGDTWTWDGTNWTQQSPASSPAARSGHAMAYDAAHSQVVLFGGSNNNGNFNDTWVWDGANWTQQSPANSPPVRSYHAMGYDAARGQVVLFGGSANSLFNDTWVWSAGNPIPLSVSISTGGTVSFTCPTDYTLIGFESFKGTYPDTSTHVSTNTLGPTLVCASVGAGYGTMENGYLNGGVPTADGNYWVRISKEGTPYVNTDFSGEWYYWSAQRVAGVWSAAGVPSAGSISVTTNLPAASFTITGPANYSGSGTSFSQANAPVGSYTITYGPASGYSAPPVGTGTLTAGGTIAFTGNYQVTSVGGQTYSVVDLGTPLGGSGEPWGINSSGQVVGETDTASSSHAFLYSGGSTIDLGTLPGGSVSSARGINDSGQIVGYSYNTASGSAFLYIGGTMTDLGTLSGRSYIEAYAINESGQVVGNSCDYYNASGCHALLYSAGTTIDLGTLPGGSFSQAYGINNSGQIVGLSNSATAAHAFLYSGGIMIDLGTLPGGDSSQANAINNSGQVVGSAKTASGDTHAFLHSGETMTDLGTLPGGSDSRAWAINDSGQVVGNSYNTTSGYTAFLYSGGTMTDLNTLVSLPYGAYLNDARGINDLGQIVAQSNNGHVYLLTPGNALLTVLNPFAPSVTLRQSPPTLSMPAKMQLVLSSPRATSLAADGKSAVVLAYQSTSPQPVTFTLSTPGTSLPPDISVGSLGQFDANYLVTPSPPGGNATTGTVTTPVSGPDAGGNYVFLALLWGPNAMPMAGNFPVVHLAVTTTQQGQSGTVQASISLEPPPLLLVHGIWSSARGAGFTPNSNGFYDWMIPGQYPHNLICPVDYGITEPDGTKLYAQSFSDPRIQAILQMGMADCLAQAAATGMAARTVDVVAHSMGGLVTRYLLSLPTGSLPPDFLPNPVHKLITIGTPHQGSQLATTLWNNQHLVSWFALAEILADPELAWLCLPVSASCTQGGLCVPSSVCTLGGTMSNLGRPVDTGVQSLQFGSPQEVLSPPSNEFAAIVGQAPSPLSPTEFLLDLLISAFLPGQSVLSILGYQPNDTIVPVSSQSPLSSGQTDSATVSGIVHGAICCGDVDETHSPVVWAQAYYWLTGGTGTVPGASPSNLALRPLTTASTIPQPVLNLSGYTQVAASNVTFLPVTGSTLTINSGTNITASSSTKTISEVLLFQNVADPTDTPLLYATQAPFTIAFTPTRLGTSTFGLIAVFSDNTYAMATLSSPAPYKTTWVTPYMSRNEAVSIAMRIHSVDLAEQACWK